MKPRNPNFITFVGQPLRGRDHHPSPCLTGSGTAGKQPGISLPAYRVIKDHLGASSTREIFSFSV